MTEIKQLFLDELPSGECIIDIETRADLATGIHAFLDGEQVQFSLRDKAEVFATVQALYKSDEPLVVTFLNEDGTPCDPQPEPSIKHGSVTGRFTTPECRITFPDLHRSEFGQPDTHFAMVITDYKTLEDRVIRYMAVDLGMREAVIIAGGDMMAGEQIAAYNRAAVEMSRFDRSLGKAIAQAGMAAENVARRPARDWEQRKKKLHKKRHTTKRSRRR